MPSYGNCVAPCGQMKMAFCTRGKLRLTPFSKPFPEPISTVSMKMPQNTPSAVNVVRSL